MTDIPPQIITAEYKGRHNSDLSKSAERLKKSLSFRDLSTVCLVPNNGLIPARVAENWFSQTSSMNQKFVRFMMIGMEKYHAFNTSIEGILTTPKLNEFKYILTMEEDTLIPPDGLLKLFESIENYDVVGGLSFTKGIEGTPIIYGDTRMIPQTMTKTSPYPETVQPCLGIGTSYTLFKMDIFKNDKVAKPWFKADPRRLLGKFTNDNIDLTFFENLHKLGYKVACDTRVRLGRYDMETDMVW